MELRKRSLLGRVGKRWRNELALGATLLVVLPALYYIFYMALPRLTHTAYAPAAPRITGAADQTPPPKKFFLATHIKTPTPVRAIYMTSWVAGNKKRREELVALARATEVNAIVIDIKDYTGKISFLVEDPLLKKIGTTENRIPDIRDFIAALHRDNIYVIGRISVFQDPALVKNRPDLAVKQKSNTSAIWKDFKGISWLDAGAEPAWEYIVALANESRRNGFDELNFDYIRFPSDGNMKDIYFPWSGTKEKSEVLRGFFAYLREKLGHAGAPISADLFGMTTTNTDDLNIGQVLENALMYFDFVAPMVYPSHYPPTFLGLKNPAAYPYEVVKYSMQHAATRARATTTTIALHGAVAIASTTPPLYQKEQFSLSKLRPWLQDFNLGAIYTADMVRKQKQAVYDSGLDSWMLWSAANHYTAGALDAQ